MIPGRTPRDAAWVVERNARRIGFPSGDRDRFHGYAVMGLPFTLGHVLALRRMTITSVGIGFTSLWHRSPDGAWSFYVDGDPDASCPRYFGVAGSRVVETEIQLTWTGPHALAVSLPMANIEWALRFETTPATRVMNTVLAALPRGVARQEPVLGGLGRVAGRALDAGRVSLSGRVPSGHWFAGMPKRVWVVSASAAMIEGREAGPIGPLAEQARLRDYLIPNRGVLAFGETCFTAPPATV